MKAVVQRVKDAKVVVDGETVGSIDHGLLVYLGVAETDNEEISYKLASKIAKLRIFRDENDKMNLSVLDVKGKVLVISQFTLFADLHHGNRPSWNGAGNPQLVNKLYEVFQKDLIKLGIETEHGSFGAHMHVYYENDGPVTILMDSYELFESKN